MDEPKDSEILLRKLQLSDAKPMLEWMLVPSIYEKMQYDPNRQSLGGCEEYIKSSWTDEKNRHYAISDVRDTYYGTVSLKNIDLQNRNAEFAIALHPKAMGRGISMQAMRLIMKKAFEEIKLHKVYLYVRSDNERAVAFYKKCKLTYEGCFRDYLLSGQEYKDVYWYSFIETEYAEWMNQTR